MSVKTGRRRKKPRPRRPIEQKINIKQGHRRTFASQIYSIRLPAIFPSRLSVQRYARRRKYLGFRTKVVNVMENTKRVGYAVYERKVEGDRMGRLKKNR